MKPKKQSNTAKEHFTLGRKALALSEPMNVKGKNKPEREAKFILRLKGDRYLK